NRVDGEAAGVGIDVEYASALGEAAETAAILPLIEEVTGLLSVQWIDLELETVLAATDPFEAFRIPLYHTGGHREAFKLRVVAPGDLDDGARPHRGLEGVVDFRLEAL